VRLFLAHAVPAVLIFAAISSGRVQAQAAPAAPAADSTAMPSSTVAPQAPPSNQPSAIQPSSIQPDQQQSGGNESGRRESSPVPAPATPLTKPVQLATEFQQIVTSSTGQTLPIYGANLFQDVPTTFSPVDNAPVTPDYVIGPGDELRIQIWGQVNQTRTETVDRTGTIYLPPIGPVHVAGIQFSQLREFLVSQLTRVYRNFDLNVNMGQLRSIQVFVVGEASRPGSYTIGSLSTLLNALFASGGPLSQGSLRDIQVRRGSTTVTHFDLYDLLLHGDKSKDVQLQSGDVIFIPKVGPQVAVLGSVTTPAIYELRNETSFDQIVALAGGRTSVAAGSSVRVERIYNHAERSVLNLDLSGPAAKDTPAQDGDIVTVGPILDRFRNAVTLRGNVANPGRYAWFAGMRISDLIPNRNALVTRNYYEKTNQLGQGNTDYRGPLPEGSLGVGAGMAAPSGQTSSAGAAADAAAARNGEFSAKTDVILQTPDIDWGYAVIQRQSATDLSTSLIPFNLGKVVLNGDASQNLELREGDVVTIFSKADIRVPAMQQTRFVRLEGEFVGAGVYSVQPGETLRQLLVRAGGFTPDAYLYGSQFTRLSTQRIERQRLMDYADTLESQISAQTSAAVSHSLSDVDAAAAQSSAAIAESIVTRLRQVTPSGRIVLELKPDSRGVDAVPDLVLEDGDRFVVPKMPSNVNVEGQVYNANAFVWEKGKRVKNYLQMAGGPERSADRRRSYVLRADGSVFSSQYGEFARAPMYPGDTLIVPPTIQKGNLLRNMADIATVLSGFGIAAAAVEVLK
jgi:protein involved in polysaccharide export with SLBB domain